MDAFIFDCWKLEMSLSRGEIIYRFSLRTVANQRWVLAIIGSHVIKKRVFYDIDLDFYRAYGDHFNREDISTLRSKRSVHNWLDRMSRYRDASNTAFVKVKITEQHLNGNVDEAIWNNFLAQGDFSNLPMRIRNGCSTYLVDGPRSDAWTQFLNDFKIKPGYVVFFYYYDIRNYGTVIFNKKRQLSPHDKKNRLPMDFLKEELVDSDTSVTTDNDADDEDEEEETDSQSEEESASSDQLDEVVPDDLDLYSSDESYSPTLQQMDAMAKDMDLIRTPSPHGDSDVSSDPDSPKNF